MIVSNDFFYLLVLKGKYFLQALTSLKLNHLIKTIPKIYESPTIMNTPDNTFVLFGARGNLSRIKLIPGLFRLDQAGRLADKMVILSIGRQEISHQDWLEEIKGMLDAKFPKGYDQTVFKRFIARNHYHCNLPDDPNAFQHLRELLSDSVTFPQNMAFFLSLRPEDFSSTVNQLAEAGLANEATAPRGD